MVSCQIPNINTGASTITFVVTVGGRTVNGGPVAYLKAAGVTTFDYNVQFLAAAAEAVVITIQSSNSSDTACTSAYAGVAQLPTAVLQSVNTTQVAGTAVTMVTEVDSNVTKWLGTAAATPAVAGVPKVELDTTSAATVAKLEDMIEVIP
jgi:hypothetical protein